MTKISSSPRCRWRGITAPGAYARGRFCGRPLRAAPSSATPGRRSSHARPATAQIFARRSAHGTSPRRRRRSRGWCNGDGQAVRPRHAPVVRSKSKPCQGIPRRPPSSQPSASAVLVRTECAHGAEAALPALTTATGIALLSTRRPCPRNIARAGRTDEWHAASWRLRQRFVDGLAECLHRLGADEQLAVHHEVRGLFTRARGLRRRWRGRPALRRGCPVSS